MSDSVEWLAGLLEGEGSFFISRSRARNKNRPCVRIEMTDRDVVARASVSAGHILGRKPMAVCAQRIRNGWTQSFRVQWVGGPAIDLMKKIRPYMGIRRGGKIDQFSP